jgi:hypothetical protein
MLVFHTYIPKAPRHHPVDRPHRQRQNDTLYAALAQLNSIDRKILTIETPSNTSSPAFPDAGPPKIASISPWACGLCKPYTHPTSCSSAKSATKKPPKWHTLQPHGHLV